MFFPYGRDDKTLLSGNKQDVMPYSVTVGYQCFRRPCWLHLQGEVKGAGEKGIDIGMEYKRGAESCSQ
jgi:hypothetical protein